MKKLAAIIFFYMITVVLLLPLVVTFLCGGFGRDLPQEAKVLNGLYGMGGETLQYGIQWIDFEKTE